LVPIFITLFMIIFKSLNIFSTNNKMLCLIIILESASPSAQVIIVAMNQLNDPKVATQLSQLYVILYSLSILTIALWIVVAIHFFY
jgi:hypothetical protein